MESPRKATIDSSVQDLCARFDRIYTGAISDVMDGMGYRDQVLPVEIQALRPDMRVSGIALPTEGEPAPGLTLDEYYLPFLNLLGDIKPGHVIISQPSDSLCAHMGELAAETAQLQGGRGVVIDGGCRDVDYILTLGFPVFCRYTTPTDIVGRWRLKSYGTPIRIGQVIVKPEDFIVGDKDGVLVIPKEITMDVLLKSEEMLSKENLVRKAVLEGVHPVKAYKEFGIF